MSLSHPKYRADIDGLRAIAVLFVVAFHAFPEWIKGGFIGVDIFFVISGFLISTIILDSLDKGTFSFIEFYQRRIRRIFPALIVVLVAVFITGWFLLLADEYKELGLHIAGGSAFISNIILWRQSGYFDGTADTKPLLHLWSLGIEEQFYIIWPLLLWLAWRWSSKIPLLIASIIFVSFALNVYYVHAHGVAVFYLPITRFWELLLGALLAYSITKKPIISSNKVAGEALPIIGAAAIAAGAYIITKDSAFPGWLALLPTIGACLIISAQPSAWFNRTILSNKILVWFGLISYPLYLWHWPILSFLNINQTDKPSAEIRTICVLLSIALAWLTYEFIEKPIRYQKKIKTSIICALMITVSCLGFGTYLLNGLSFRLPAVLAFEGGKIDKDWQLGTRCYIQPGEDASLNKEKNQCVKPGKGKMIYLWGDSFATALTPGLNHLHETSNIGIAEFTAAACPPLLGWVHPTRPLCKPINDENIKFISDLRPDTVILHSTWSYAGLDHLKETVRELRKIGTRRIVIIGPIPMWNKFLPRILFNGYRGAETLPSRIKDGVAPYSSEIDNNMRRMAKELGVEYISPYQKMCDKNGCLTYVDGKIVTYDTGHLTTAGSIWLIDQIRKDLLR